MKFNGAELITNTCCRIKLEIECVLQGRKWMFLVNMNILS